MRPIVFFSAACFVLLQSPAIAQESTEAADKPLAVTGDFSYVSTSGNSEAQTLAGTEKLEQRSGSWLFTQEAGAVYGTSAGVENAGRYRFNLRADREISQRVAVYGLTSWTRNPFGAVARRFDEGIGIVGHVIAPEPNLLDVEAGAGLAQRRTTEGEDENFATGRLATLYRHTFRPKTYFELEGVYLHDFEHTNDYETQSRASLVAAVSNLMAVKVGYTYLYRNEPPAGIKNYDATFATGIQLTF